MATKKTIKVRKVATKRKPAAGATKRANTAAAPKVKKRVVAAKPTVPGVGPRRIIFVDVENTSSEQSLFEVIDSLKIDRQAQPTEINAVGNWRAVGLHVGRRLGTLGAQLVHSAPARGVRDWSDLWIAVAAGCWLGQAAPGDVLDIVSNDRAFDAVGDAAAARGVVFHRVQHRRGGVASAPPAEPIEPKAPRRRTRGGRRRRRSGQAPATTAPPRSLPTPTAAPAAPQQAEPHGASRDQMIGVLGRLTNGELGRWVNLDVLEKALKNEGFARPPGSPRLVTRLRMLKEVEVDAHGRVRLAAKSGDAAD